jgi:hypothetical protein
MLRDEKTDTKAIKSILDICCSKNPLLPENAEVNIEPQIMLGQAFSRLKHHQKHCIVHNVCSSHTFDLFAKEEPPR